MGGGIRETELAEESTTFMERTAEMETVKTVLVVDTMLSVSCK